jgi:hypothetical protein
MIHALALLLAFAQQAAPDPAAPQETLAIEHVSVLTMSMPRCCPTRP